MKKKKTLNQKTGLGLLIATLLVIATCDNSTKPVTEKPDPIIPTPIEKTYVIELKDSALKFNVKYMALPDATPPAYLSYLKSRLELISNQTAVANVQAIENLIANGGEFIITVESKDDVSDGLNWNTATRTFQLRHDWISTASDTDLSILMMRNAFNSVTPVENAMLKNFTKYEKTYNDRHLFCLVSLVTV